MGFRLPAAAERRERLERELGRIVARLAEAGARKIVLFGSVARSEVASTSDLDLIVVQETDRPFTARIEEALRLTSPRVATDILVYTPDEFSELQRSNAFVQRALREGTILYEAKP